MFVLKTNLSTNDDLVNISYNAGKEICRRAFMHY